MSRADSHIATEVEIKAWVVDPAAVARTLDDRFPLIATYRKDDAYFRLESGIEFRIRTENGAEIVTAKKKSLADGVEVNREIEFSVSDRAAFEEFAAALGSRLFIRKQKIGKRYDAGAMTVELSDVAGLGTFVEIEALLTAATEADVRNAREGVIRLLDELGVAREKIEPRYYVDLLRERSEGSLR